MLYPTELQPLIPIYTRIEVRMVESRRMGHFSSFTGIHHNSCWEWASQLTASDWIAVASLVAALASLVVAVASFVVARKTLADAAEDWAQRKWFELYQQADYAYDLLDRFRQVHPAAGSTNSGQMASDWNETMLAIRRAHAMAVVFPVNPTIANFRPATAVFGNMQNAYNQTIVDAFFDGVQDLRDMATLKSEVLNRRKP